LVGAPGTCRTTNSGLGGEGRLVPTAFTAATVQEYGTFATKGPCRPVGAVLVVLAPGKYCVGTAAPPVLMQVTLYPWIGLPPSEDGADQEASMTSWEAEYVATTLEGALGTVTGGDGLYMDMK